MIKYDYFWNGQGYIIKSSPNKVLKNNDSIEEAGHKKPKTIHESSNKIRHRYI